MHIHVLNLVKRLHLGTCTLKCTFQSLNFLINFILVQFLVTWGDYVCLTYLAHSMLRQPSLAHSLQPAATRPPSWYPATTRPLHVVAAALITVPALAASDTHLSTVVVARVGKAARQGGTSSHQDTCKATDRQRRACKGAPGQGRVATRWCTWVESGGQGQRREREFSMGNENLNIHETD